MNIVISLTDSLAPFKPFIHNHSLSYLQQYPFFFSESLVSYVDKKTLKFCLMISKASSKHPMNQKLFTYDATSYLLFSNNMFKFIQRIKVQNFIKTLYKKYQDKNVSLTLLTPIHLVKDLGLTSFIKNKPFIKIILIHFYHLHSKKQLPDKLSTYPIFFDHIDNSTKKTIVINPLKTKLTTLSMIKHRYIFASFVHLNAKKIHDFIDNFLAIKMPDMHMYIELLDNAFLPYPYVSIDPRIHFLPSMTNKERTSYIQHAYVNMLAIDDPQPLLKTIYFDMALQLTAIGIPLFATHNETLSKELDEDTYWLKSLTTHIIKKAFLTIAQNDYSPMIRVALSNQAYVEKKYNGENFMNRINKIFKNKEV